MPEGPLFRLLHLKEPRVAIRAILGIAITWVPLVALAGLQELLGSRDGDLRRLMKDVSVHGRFLVSVPLLIYADRLFSPRVRDSAEQLLEQEMVRPADVERYRKLCSRMDRLAVSPAIALVLLGVGYLLSVTAIYGQLSTDMHDWAVIATGDQVSTTMSGWWFELVSLPLAWYLLLRWLWRFFLWDTFLWKLSVYDLVLDAAHPDRTGGLAFLASAHSEIAIVLAALGVALSTSWSQQVLQGIGNAKGFVMVALAFVIAAPLIAILPLTVFLPVMRDLRWRGRLQYGKLAARYVRAFARRWIDKPPADDKELLGSADVQSLSDMMNAFGTVQSMQWFPMTKNALLKLIFSAVGSMLPLVVLDASLRHIVKRLVMALLRV